MSSSAVKDLAVFLRTSDAILGTCSQDSLKSYRMLARAMATWMFSDLCPVFDDLMLCWVYLQQLLHDDH